MCQLARRPSVESHRGPRGGLSHTRTDQSRSLSLAYTSHSRSLAPSLSHTHTHSRTHSDQSRTLARTLSLFLFLSLEHTHTLVDPLHARTGARTIYREACQLIAKSVNFAKPINFSLRIRELLQRMGQLPSRCQANSAQTRQSRPGRKVKVLKIL